VELRAPTSEEWAIDAAERRRGLLTIAGAVLSFLPADVLLVHRLDPVLLGARLGWSLLLVLGAAITRMLGPARTKLVDASLIVGSNLFFVWIVVLTGGAHSAYLAWLLVMPLALTPFTLGDARITTLGWAICAVASFAFLWNHADAHSLWVWAFLMGGSGFLGMYGTVFRTRLTQKLRSLQQARELMVVQLADVERQRGYAERLALVGQLAAGVAHEINNPLAFVHANLAFVRVEADRLPEAARLEVVQALHEAERGVERIQSIIRDLRVFARKDQEAPELVYLGDVVADALVLARASALVPLQCLTAPGLPPVRAVARHLGEVVLNLLVNAADALERLPEGAERAVSLRVFEESGAVCISVEDSGGGLSAELRDRIFDPFFTTKPVGQGTGLGLALAREYVERYGGQLLAENRAEGGARFTLRLPAVEGAAPADAPWEKQPVGDPDVTPIPRRRSGPRPTA
jgi:signal transduction histidine kinase